jgi:hypothetical protein
LNFFAVTSWPKKKLEKKNITQKKKKNQEDGTPFLLRSEISIQKFFLDSLVLLI